MSGSGLGNNMDQFPLSFNIPQSQPQPQPQPQPEQIQNTYASDAAAVYTAVPLFQQASTVAAAATVNGGESASAAVDAPQGGTGLGELVGSSSEQMKKKRGRPRKYGPGGSMSMGLTGTPPAASAAAAAQLQFSPGAVNQPAGGEFSPAAPTPATTATPGSSKRGRGRPRGSRSKTYTKRRKTGESKDSITPHVITVEAGEDLSSKVVALSQSAPRNVFILSANGTVSNVTLLQPSTTAGTVAYEGTFEILTLNGSFVQNENGSQRSRRGGLSVSLSGPDGRVLGGGVAGLMIAAAPIQLVVGSFVSEGPKQPESENKMENAPPPTSAAGPSSSPSGGTLSESSDESGSPLDQSTEAGNDTNTTPSISGMPWK